MDILDFKERFLCKAPVRFKDHYVYDMHGKPFNSFWKTVIESPQWEAWMKEQDRRMAAYDGSPESLEGVFDFNECMECGWISEKHFQAFLEFTTKNSKS